MEFYEIILILVREIIRPLCLIASLFGWVWWLHDTLKYFAKKEYYVNLIRSKNIKAVFHCIRSYLFVFLHWYIIMMLCLYIFICALR